MNNIEVLQAQLQAALTAGAQQNATSLAAMQPAQIFTQEAMMAILDAAFAKNMPRVNNTMVAFDDVFKRALPAEDYSAFLAYTQKGAPGFAEMMQSDTFFPIAQLLWETIKENVK